MMENKKLLATPKQSDLNKNLTSKSKISNTQNKFFLSERKRKTNKFDQNLKRKAYVKNSLKNMI